MVLGCEDDQVFVRGLGDLLIDLLPRDIVRQRLPTGDALIGDEAPLLGDGFERERRLAYHDGGVGAAVIPAELLHEQRTQIERLQQSPHGRSIDARCGLHGFA